MLREIVFSALLAGLVGGLLVSALQATRVTPLIIEAERYEVAAPSASSASEDHDHAADDEEWAPAEGAERIAYTVLANVLLGVGFAFLLVAAFALYGGVDWRRGLLWGLGGFLAFHLAPALGLPPELPGMAAGDVAARQIWWLGTVSASAAGLTLLVFARHAAFKALGAGLLILPHVIGAPRPEAGAGLVPAELAAAFVSATLVTNLLFWLTVGGVAGFAYRRLAAT